MHILQIRAHHRIIFCKYTHRVTRYWSPVSCGFFFFFPLSSNTVWEAVWWQENCYGISCYGCACVSIMGYKFMHQRPNCLKNLWNKLSIFSYPFALSLLRVKSLKHEEIRQFRIYSPKQTCQINRNLLFLNTNLEYPGIIWSQYKERHEKFYFKKNSIFICHFVSGQHIRG